MFSAESQTKKCVCFYFIRIICIKYLNGKEMEPFSLGLRLMLSQAF